MRIHNRRVVMGMGVVVVVVTCVCVLHSPVWLWSSATLHTHFSKARELSYMAELAEEKGKTLDQVTDELLPVLQQRLHNYTGWKYDYTATKCGNYDFPDRVCYDESCPGHFSPSLRVRLKQILATRTSIPTPYLQALASAAQAVTSHRYIFVTGASSNHYYEMQAFMKSVHLFLFPRMKGEDFSLVFYNLGLSDHERRMTEKNCGCTVVDFPFAKLPSFLTDLQCYAWKPLIVASLLQKAEYLTWMDSSVRLSATDPFPEMFQRARDHGLQARNTNASIAVRTKGDMARFFGDHLCQYSAFSEMEGNFFVLHNDRLTREAFLHPWLSCAFSPHCMCIQDHRQHALCHAQPRHRVYGRCHRFDQSALGMIASKLFLRHRPMLYVPGFIRVARNTRMYWFKAR